MEWCINLMLAIVLMTITGGIFTIIWYVVGNLLERVGYLNIVFVLLNGVAIFWLIPMAYLMFRVRGGWIEQWIQTGTTWIGLGAALLCLIWAAGVVVGVVGYVRDYLKCVNYRRAGFSCKESVNAIFRETCEALEVSSKRCRLVQSYSAPVPCVSGVFRPCVILPVENFSEQQLRVIILHELLHYKQHDLWLKQVTSLVGILNTSASSGPTTSITTTARWPAY